jgi:biopolymer transport protein ExbD
MTLPGTVSQEETLDLPDEQRLEIKANGQIVLNEMEVGAPADATLPQLHTLLLRYKESCDANKSEALVTLDPEDEAVHQRIADVMNACARAGITGVTFASAPDEENDF